MKLGDILIDNDPRMNGRRLVIERFGVSTTHGVEYVFARNIHGRSGRLYSIATRRIYTDGKPRRSGFTLAATPASPTKGAQEGKAS